MGVMSRRVLPLCGSLCVCCPGLRARSRQPVKRYKKLLADLFPKSQLESPNDRKIAKLCEYASKNPLRVPKIAKALEQRGYKDLRHEHHGSVRVVMQTFCKLFSSCKEQMPMLATSALNMIHVLLEETQQDDMRVLGCLTLVEFVKNQTDTTYMHNLSAFLPKLCLLAKETGGEKRRYPLRAAGLRALSAMIWFMGECSHIPSEFDEIVAVVFNNYEVPSVDLEAEYGEVEPIQNLVKGIFKGDGRGAMALMKDAFAKFSLGNSHLKDPLNLTREESELPSTWAQICVQNMACLGREATTVRRVLESVFNYFDLGQHWLHDRDVALAVLRDMQFFMGKTGNDHLILGALVKHLDHKSISQKLQLKTEIIKIAAVLARHSKPRSTMSEVGIINDLSRHLRKSLQLSMELSEKNEMESHEWNSSLQVAIQGCLAELAKRIGDSGPILDMMAVILEKLSTSYIVARTTVEAMTVIAHIVVSLPNQSYKHQVFPEALFYQLLQAMVHPDVETRVRAHHVFFLLLVPASITEDIFGKDPEPHSHDPNKMPFRSSFTAVTILLEKLGDAKDKYDIKKQDSFSDSKQLSSSNSAKEMEMTAVKLSGHQASLLLSNLSVQAVLPDNVPASYEAIAHTYCLTLLFSRPKTSNHCTFIRAFQLAFCLRNFALDPHGLQSASRRRSLFTLATAMLVFACIAYDISEVIPLIRSSMPDQIRDPFLELVDDSRLKVVSSMNMEDYATLADEEAASMSFSQLSTSSYVANESVVFKLVEAIPAHLAVKDSNIAEEMLQKFVPDDTFAVAPNFRDALVPSDAFDEFLAGGPINDDLAEPPATGVPPLIANTPVPPTPSRAMGVSQLLESALEAAGQVASISTPNSPIPYTTLASQCEAFIAGTRKSMSIVMKLEMASKSRQSHKPEVPSDVKGKWTQSVTCRNRSFNQSPSFSPPWLTPTLQEPWQYIKLPPASPYDNFLKAAGC